MIALIDGKASEDGYWYRFRHVAPETAGGRRRADGAGGERIIPNDNVIGANDKLREAPLTWLARARRLSQSSRIDTSELKAPN